MKILSSASRTVFVLMTIGLNVLTYLGTIEAKDYITLCGMTFTYYYMRNKNASSTDKAVE